MFRAWINRRLFLWTGIVLVAGALFLDKLGSHFVKKNLSRISVQRIQKKLNERQKNVEGLFDRMKAESFSEVEKSFDRYMDMAREKGIYIYVYTGKKLLLWNDQQALPRLNKISFNRWKLVHLQNGKYLAKQTRDQNHAYVALIPLKTNYPVENRYLKNRLMTGMWGNDWVRLVSGEKKGIPVYSRNDHYLFSLKMNKGGFNWGWLVWLYISGFFFLSLFFISVWSAWEAKGKKAWSTGLFIFLLVLILLDRYFIQFPSLLFSDPLFSAQYYASYQFPSFGDLLLFVILITLFIGFFKDRTRLDLENKVKIRWFLGISGFMVSTVIAWLVILLFRSVVIHSNIPLSINNLFDFTFISFLAYGVLYLLLFDYFTLNFWFYRQIESLFEDPRNGFILLITGGILGMGAGLLFSGMVWYAFIPPVLLWSVFWGRHRLGGVNFSVILLLLGAIFGATHLKIFNQEKEKEYRKLWATRLTSERDPVTEYLLQNLSAKLKNDRYVRNFFFDPLISRDILAKRIEQLYFSGYLEKYDVHIYTYGWMGLPFKSTLTLSLKFFHDQIDQHGQQVGQDQLFFINKIGALPEYLFIQQFEKKGHRGGSLVIQMKRKTFFEESIYPALFLDKELRRKEELSGYSFSIYNQGKLVRQKGKYPYPLVSPYQEVSKPFMVYQKGGYSHLLHRINEGSYVIVSKKQKGVLYPLALFSLLFLLFSLVFLLLAWFLPRSFHIDASPSRRKYWKVIWVNPFRNMLFQRKIQWLVLLTVFLGLTIIGFSTFNYLKFKYNERLKESLQSKIKLVLNNVEKVIHDEPSKFRSGNEKFTAEIKRLSTTYQLDINLFNKNGRLVASSQPNIFEQKVLAPVMNGEVFYQFMMDEKSQMIKNESIGKLEFVSAYSPLRKDNGKILGYLQLPFFSKETELRKEISSLLVTLLNLYVLVFILVTGISFLISRTVTNPLRMIREKIRSTQLGGKNQPIHYGSRDEIGQLIREYNRMIRELERSAGALARSEREVAWREMARQVAHEIKNPLTPMKLNIQQLQRSLKKGDQQKDEQKLQNVTRILINQINQLSRIATEFSAFAKIPAGKPEKTHVEEVLFSVADFFDGNPGYEIHRSLRDENSYIWIDRDHLSRVLNNLVKNAIQSLPSGRTGVIELFCTREDGKITFGVKDNGKGIPEDKRDKIFSPNFSTKTSGMGLGLAIVKNIVMDTNGKIWFRSEENNGTAFYLQFPLYEKEK